MEQEQVLLDDGLVRVTLLKGGALGKYSTDLTMLLKLENLSATEQTVSIKGAEVNGAQVSESEGLTLPANCMGYCACEIAEYDLSKNGITAIETLKLNVERRTPEDWRVTSEWVTVQLDSVN